MCLDLQELFKGAEKEADEERGGMITLKNGLN
jgi:hypothetical protein